jgi:hypothetical protein
VELREYLSVLSASSARCKPIGLLVLGLISALACADAPAGEAAAGHASAATPSAATPSPGSPSSVVDPLDLPARDPSPNPQIEPQAPPQIEPQVEGEGELAGETESPREPTDPLAPILPEGPEPGSPEADAELAALLDESTITQDEFDKAFRGGGPTIKDDQLVFGPNQRTRAQPMLGVGQPRVLQGKVTVAELEALVLADERKLLGCHAVALTDDPTIKGAPTLHLRFDESGSNPTITITGGDALPRALTECLLAVAKTWRPAGAAGAKLEVPLTLSTK